MRTKYNVTHNHERLNLLPIALRQAEELVRLSGRGRITEAKPEAPRCVFCGAEAVALYRLNRGCLCRPDDREQHLCAQHEVRATPLGSMELVEDYRRTDEPKIDPDDILPYTRADFMSAMREDAAEAERERQRHDEHLI